MKFLVIGHLCVDVFGEEETPTTSGIGGSPHWGGIFFSLAALANLAEDALIFPVFGVGTSEYEPFLERLRRYPNVDPSGIFRLPGPTNRVLLLHQDTERRVECSRSIAPSIPLERIEPYLEADAILVNMISGFDLALETLTTLRMLTQQNRTVLHFDLHSLTLGVDEEDRRYPRPLDTWRRWCYLADTVQMNEKEAKGLTLESLQEEDLVKQIFSLGVRGFLLTRGSSGVTAWAQLRKKISREDLLPVSVDPIIDPTGCGDVFAAAFCYDYAHHQDVHSAAGFANRIAACNVAYRGSEEIDTIAQIRRQVEEAR